MRARARKRVEKSNWQLTWQQTNDKRLSVGPTVPLSHCPTVCTQFAGSDSDSESESPLTSWGAALKTANYESRARGRGQGLGRKSANFIITWLVKTFAAQWVWPIVCWTKLSGRQQVQVQSQRVSESIWKIHWTMPSSSGAVNIYFWQMPL